MIERVQVMAAEPSGRPTQAGDSGRVGLVRRGTAGIGIVYTGLAFGFIGDDAHERIDIMAWWFVAGLAVTVAPLLTRGTRAFRVACRIDAGFVALIVVLLFFIGGFMLFPALIPLLVAGAKSRRTETWVAFGLVVLAVSALVAAYFLAFVAAHP